MKKLVERFAENRVFRSIVRHGYPDTNKNRSLLVFSNLFLHMHAVKVRVRAMAFSRTLYLGGLSGACFFILTLTGVLLMFYYRPAVPHAYHDMKDLEFVVAPGMLLRNLHRWGAHLMVALVFVHMLLTFYRGAYHPPREFNWVVGVGLFVGTLLLSYTGYLLPWDQLAFWAVTVGSNMAEATPLIGEWIKLLLLGGTKIDETTLNRFYVLHCVGLPLIVMTGILLHIWRIRKDGGIHLPHAAQKHGAPTHAAEKAPEEAHAMSFPHLLLRELVALLAVSVALVLVSVFFDAPLEEIANPNKTPNPAKAPWYFLGLQELLHYYPPVISGVILPGAVVILLTIIPYFHVNQAREPLFGASPIRTGLWLWLAIASMSFLFLTTGAHPVWPIVGPLGVVGLLATLGSVPTNNRVIVWLRHRSLAMWIFTWFVLCAVLLTVIGTFFRGPGWSFTLPWRDGVF